MAEAEHLKKLEALKIENRRLNEKLCELSESIAELKKARALAVVHPSDRTESSRLN